MKSIIRVLISSHVHSSLYNRLIPLDQITFNDYHCNILDPIGYFMYFCHYKCQNIDILNFYSKTVKKKFSPRHFLIRTKYMLDILFMFYVMCCANLQNFDQCKTPFVLMLISHYLMTIKCMVKIFKVLQYLLFKFSEY